MHQIILEWGESPNADHPHPESGDDLNLISRTLLCLQNRKEGDALGIEVKKQERKDASCSLPLSQDRY